MLVIGILLAFVLKPQNMGSFYLSCAVSGLTLWHQKCAVILLSKMKYDACSSGYFLSNDFMGTCLYKPFGFPIFGEYYDYGEMQNIERDANVQLLESYFETDIATILSQDFESEKLGCKLYQAYIHRDIYQYIVNIDNSKKMFAMPQKALSKDLQVRNYEQTPREFFSFHYSEANFFELLNLDESFAPQLIEMFNFLINLTKLNKQLLPCNYAGQDINFVDVINFSKQIIKVAEKDLRYFEQLD